MKYTCSTCGKAFDSRWDCERHEKKCGKDKSFTISLIMRNEKSISFYWSINNGIEVDNYGSISEVNYQDEDGHDLYELGCRCKDKSEIDKVKKSLIREMEKHLREAIKRLDIPDGIDSSEWFDDED